MKCLDTYALVEITNGNTNFLKLLDEETVITDITISEFYGYMFDKHNIQTADYWYKKLSFLCVPVSREILVKSVLFRKQNKKQNLSFFDCVGYVFSRENKIQFVTGDREFKDKEGVLFIK